jgi:hypothetical protein
MTSQGYSLPAAWRALANGWNEFFHAPQDLHVCAAVRIAYGLVMLVNLAVLYPDLALWYTDAGILPAEASRELGESHKWSLLWQFPSTEPVVRLCFGLWTLHTVFVLVGFLPRLNALAALVWLISFHNRNWQILDGEDWVMRVITFWLIWMPCGRCWSVNAVLVRLWRSWFPRSASWFPRSASWFPRSAWEPTDSTLRVAAEPGPRSGRAGVPTQSVGTRCVGPAWGLRMLQIQMAVIFFTAGLWKLAGEPWIFGTAIYTVSRTDDFFGRFPVPSWLFDQPWTVALMTWAVIAVEIAAPVLIWFRETRRFCLVGILLFHLANEWTMHLFLFHWIMLAGWIAFLTPADFAWLWRGRLVNTQTLPALDSQL